MKKLVPSVSAFSLFKKKKNSMYIYYKQAYHCKSLKKALKIKVENIK